MEQVEEIKKLDVEKIRQDFPILLRKVNGKTLVYFDNAATSRNQNVLLISMSMTTLVTTQTYTGGYTS